ncbi:ATP-dependent DNA helicase RecG [Intestinibaculum porci]|uniref:ATP-dependent DNA helicase RecG n=1 Tax=Intestinibaculum porci TaxID=2487118 RepID=A0A3G9J2P8_9FIRM|nr:ATP-binding protein [Intestinibaculum porci]BBH25457.1 ATP-dependent DNA helicase RecG [Intestinibaculum porci]
MNNFDVLEHYSHDEEGQYFDRKSARIKPKDIARHLVAFANGNGGELVIGIEDDGEISGFDYPQANPLNDFLDIPFTYCKGDFRYQYQIYDVEVGDRKDQVLVFEVNPSENKVIKTIDNKVYLRVGDQSKLLSHDQITQLEFDKGERYFEDLILEDSSYDDVDMNTIDEYRSILKTSLSGEEILKARNLLKNGHLTYAGALLFAKYPTQFLPNARVRVLKFDGNKMHTGERLNISKDKNFEENLPTLLKNIREFITTLLKEYQFLDRDGIFKTVSEYPEFAWLEGIVNSVTHRDYSFRGDYIRVSIYDDRLEVFSPGKLPNIVTLDNMIETRYSRNPRIARVLNEFGFVRELNEGVKRIYEEMDHYFLNKPIYSEPNNNAVLLVLENNSKDRKMKTTKEITHLLTPELLRSLDESEMKIIQYVTVHGRINIKKTKKILGKGDTYSRRRLKNLQDKKILRWHGTNKTDPYQYYSLEDLYDTSTNS